jgi:beta-lactamase superfamily II metal-dependent hydrolase
MVELFMLPALCGDCLWLEYGSADAKKRILIDCGLPGTWTMLKERISTLPKTQRHFELLVVTHIDVDHIGGAISLLGARKDLGITFGEIWFNGQQHLPDDALGKAHADKLSELLSEDDLLPIWNARFGGAVVVPDTGDLPHHRFDDFAITLLSPTPAGLANLLDVWPKATAQAGISSEAQHEDEVSEPPLVEDEDDDRLGAERADVASLLAQEAPTLDSKEPNGSSIAFILEVDGARILFAADAFAPVLERSIERLHKDKPCKLSAFKLSHHGSRRNITEALLQKLECTKFLISSNGGRFPHPDAQTIALLVKDKVKKALYFNYRSKQTELWDCSDLQYVHKFKAHYVEESEYKVPIK